MAKSDAEYIAMGKKAEERREKSKEASGKRKSAVKKLIAAHQDEYNSYLGK